MMIRAQSENWFGVETKTFELEESVEQKVFKDEKWSRKTMFV